MTLVSLGDTTSPIFEGGCFLPYGPKRGHDVLGSGPVSAGVFGDAIRTGSETHSQRWNSNLKEDGKAEQTPTPLSLPNGRVKHIYQDDERHHCHLISCTKLSIHFKLPSFSSNDLYTSPQ